MTVVVREATDKLRIVRFVCPLLVIALALLSGCGASRALGKSMSAYEAGNYQRTISFCEAHDPDEFEGRRYVRYTVYCGLAYYHAGDTATARTLLENGQAALDEDEGSLKPSVANDLSRALRELNGQGGAKASPPSEEPPTDDDVTETPGIDPVPGE